MLEIIIKAASLNYKLSFGSAYLHTLSRENRESRAFQLYFHTYSGLVQFLVHTSRFDFEMCKVLEVVNQVINNYSVLHN